MKIPKLLLWSAWGVVTALALTASAAGGVFFYLRQDLPSFEELASRQVTQSTKIYDRTGTVLLYEISNGTRRTVVPFDQIPEALKQATVAIEDTNFYHEPAFDWQAIIRAAAVDLIRGRIVQGGSTITQQLVKNAFLTDEQTLTRKIKEFILAVELNRHYSKDEILNLYLNEIPYGPTAYGVEAASETYFGKPVSQLNLAECALLAALPRAPTYYSPWGSHLDELIARQRQILQKMESLGEISKQDLAAALKYKLAFSPRDKGIKAPHFVMAVEDYLTQKYGENLVREGGLTVTTTLDWGLQQAAEKDVADGAARNAKLYGGSNAALVAEDASTGQILALAGSADYFDTQNGGNFNVAVQGLRQPGSSLKPFVYYTAFTKGYTPDTVLFDVPTEFAAGNPQCPPVPDYANDAKECFHPQDYTKKFDGPVSMRDALAQSLNIPAVKTLYLAGIPDVISNLNKFGLTTLTDPGMYGLSLVLGGGAVHLIDLVKAYTVLAQDGTLHDQAMVLRVEDSSGNVLESYADQASQVADPEYVRLVNDVLSDPVARAPLFGTSLNLSQFPDADVAVKTGTSNDYRDAWTVGYTPNLVVGVWAGNNDNSPMHRQGSSILASVPIWSAFMSQALLNQPLSTFPRPAPQTPAKPVLRGEYLINGQVHSILYYVDRQNPTGPDPASPQNDPQFLNWETGVLGWAKQNLPAAVAASTSTAPSPLKVSIVSPQNGASVSGDVPLAAALSDSSSSIGDVKISANGSVVQEFRGDLGGTYALRWSIPASLISNQDEITVSASDAAGNSGQDSVVVYKSSP